MPYDYIDLGPVPCEEAAASVGSPDYQERSRRECLVFKRLIERLTPVPADADAKLVVKSYPHDFGSYREVVVKFNPEDAAACDYAYALESATPPNWDDIARYELFWMERRDQALAEVARGERAQAELSEDFRLNRMPLLSAGVPFVQLLAAHPI